MKPAGSLALIINPFRAEEILLADDGSGHKTCAAFERWAAAQACHTDHLRQTNEGFRRSRILIETIARTRGDHLVFLDSDTIPHPRVVTDHQVLASEGFSVQGHRALSGQRAAVWFEKNGFAADCFRALRLGQAGRWKRAFHRPCPRRRIRHNFHGIRCALGLDQHLPEKST